MNKEPVPGAPSQSNGANKATAGKVPGHARLVADGEPDQHAVADGNRTKRSVDEAAGAPLGNTRLVADGKPDKVQR